MKQIFFSIVIWLLCQISFAQISADLQVIGSTGNLTNSGLLITSSNVGEAVIVAFSQSNLIVTQGFEQPDTFIIINQGVREVSLINISAYPNPTMKKVILDFMLDNSMDIGIDIFNETGQQLGNHLQVKVQNNGKQELDFSGFSSGNYYIVIKSTDRKLSKTFNVQKIN